MTPLLLNLSASAMLALLGCGGAEAGNQENANTDALAVPTAPGTRVEVAVITPSQATLELSIPGEIEGAEDALLASPQGGYIEAVMVNIGDEVRRGQALIRVNSAIFAAQNEQAQAQLAQAQASLRRVEALGDLASEAQLEGARTQARIAEANAQMTEINLSRSVIRAPFDGVVAQLNASKAEIAAPGNPLVRVVMLDPVMVSASVSDRDVVAMREGMPAKITTEAVPDLFDGVVQHIDPAASLQTRAFTVKISTPNPDRRLLPGMIASVRIMESMSSDTIIIPQDWLVTRIDGVGVYIDNNGTAEWRDVSTGSVVHDQVVIEDGLQMGARLIMTGHRGLTEGDALIVTREGTCCEHGRAVFEEIQ